ncbi:ABC-type tungstate transport system, permease protein [uncultured Candidatus Thioglobus sp.]|nr:ABC-type tungstate transport system, permease protein [uncultured Candidatus Thioglobus sp.]
MDTDLSNVILNALGLLFSGDSELWEIVFVSLRVSLLAILIATPLAILLSFILFEYHSRLKRIIIAINNTLVAVPAVVVGLIVYLFLSKQGLLGDLHWLFTQKAMILGQVLLAFPIILNISYSGFKSIHKGAQETALTFGANYWQLTLTMIFECRLILLTAVVTAFGRIIAEVGSAIMVGGNILHYTRSITTAITLETSKGEFTQGVALGIVLLILAFALNFSISLLVKRSESYD